MFCTTVHRRRKITTTGGVTQQNCLTFELLCTGANCICGTRFWQGKCAQKNMHSETSHLSMHGARCILTSRLFPQKYICSKTAGGAQYSMMILRVGMCPCLPPVSAAYAVQISTPCHMYFNTRKVYIQSRIQCVCICIHVCTCIAQSMCKGLPIPKKFPLQEPSSLAMKWYPIA